MLFSSELFVLVFLPITLTGFFLIARLGTQQLAMGWLVAASAYFSAFFKVEYLFLLIASIVADYFFGRLLLADFRRGVRRPWLLTLSIAINLVVLAYFKYTNFIVFNVNGVFGTDFVFQQIVLPIGISFFTFQKIAYLVDAYRGEAQQHGFIQFALFVSYFPQLIAGPIVHHKEMMPQFQCAEVFRPSAFNFAAGITLFSIGLFKKIIIADNVSVWSDAYFALANGGAPLTFFESWIGALAFTFQIYFDFSGYTDMALGLALMIGIRLPVNFNSPYKATSIIDFWRRWHITLSRFLRDYVYISLGGNRRGRFRRYTNLMLTMLIGGLWHGAAWTFVVWGGLHGAFLIINHGWNHIKGKLGISWCEQDRCAWIGRIMTFLAVVVAWVFFRAESFSTAIIMLEGMVGSNGIVLPTDYTWLLGLLQFVGVEFNSGLLAGASNWDMTKPICLVILVAAVWTLPNSQQLLAYVRPALQDPDPARMWRPFVSVGTKFRILRADGTVSLNMVTGVIVGSSVLGCLVYQAASVTTLQPFIYFQF